MDGLYSVALIYFLVACVCALPGILGAAFGRGPWMVVAGALSAWTLYAVSPLGIGVHAWSGSTTPFWVAPMVGVVLAAFCACLATMAERRKRKDRSDEF
jgi:4-amino-4-deoxy-L-arabinose transferase-like glycosyltransferase